MNINNFGKIGSGFSKSNIHYLLKYFYFFVSYHFFFQTIK